VLAQSLKRQDTGVVKTFGTCIVFVVAIIVVAGVSWVGLRQHQRHRAQIACTERDAAFERKLESIKQDAHERLTIGTKKADVSRFFTDHGMTFGNSSASEVMGTLQTTACAPNHCGDGVLLGVRVKLELADTVTEEPTVESLYSDCP
jgi:hypothetical protein